MRSIKEEIPEVEEKHRSIELGLIKKYNSYGFKCISIHEMMLAQKKQAIALCT